MRIVEIAASIVTKRSCCPFILWLQIRRHIEPGSSQAALLADQLQSNPPLPQRKILQIVTIATMIAQLLSKMAEEEVDRRPLSCPAGPLSDRKLSAEKLPNTRPFSMGAMEEGGEEEMSDELLEEILIERAKDGDSLAKFQLGQFYFEREIFDKALIAFERIKSTDFQAKYQLGVMYYDGIGTKPNPVSIELLRNEGWRNIWSA